MKKRTIAMLIIMTIVFSGVAGFGGTYFAGIFAGRQLSADSAAQPASSKYEKADTSASEDAFNFGQIGEYIDGYLASHGKKNASQDNQETSLEKQDTSSDKQDASQMKLETSPDKQDASQMKQETSFPETTLLTAVTDSTRKQLTIPEIAALNSNSVVEIYTESVTNSGRMGQFITEGAGSGVIITADGYIITNNHVIEGSRKITVRLNNGNDYEATLVGRDSKTDIAVLKIKVSGLQPAVYGNSDSLVVGELVVAIGNPLGELGGTVTEGIISALSRNIEIDGNMMALLQTSAAVNPGNSGGGLFNGYGELIGIVNAKSSGSDIEGIGFAIPGNLAKYIAESLIKYGYIPGRIELGLTLVNVLDPMTAMMYRVQTTGVYVSQANTDSQLRSGDRIISINGNEIRSIADVTGLLEKCKVGDILSVVISRGGNTMTVEHTLKQAKS